MPPHVLCMARNRPDGRGQWACLLHLCRIDKGRVDASRPAGAPFAPSVPSSGVTAQPSYVSPHAPKALLGLTGPGSAGSCLSEVCCLPPSWGYSLHLAHSCEPRRNVTTSLRLAHHTSVYTVTQSEQAAQLWLRGEKGQKSPIRGPAALHPQLGLVCLSVRAPLLCGDTRGRGELWLCSPPPRAHDHPFPGSLWACPLPPLRRALEPTDLLPPPVPFNSAIRPALQTSTVRA